LILLLLTALPLSGIFAAETLALFENDVALAGAARADRAGERRRGVRMSAQAVAALADRKGLPQGVKLRLPFFADAAFTAVVDASETVGGSQVSSVHVDGHDGSSGLLSVNGAAVFGSVFVPGEGAFEIRADLGGGHEVRRLGPSRKPECGDRPMPPLAADAAPVADQGAPEQPLQVMAAADAVLYIDIMVLYTPVARTQAGGTPAMEALIAAAIGDANTTYGNSMVNPRLRLAHSAEINYDESTGMIAALSAITSGSTATLIAARALRDTHQADVVCLMTWDDEPGEPAGIGWMMEQSNSSFAPYAYSVVNIDFAVGNHSFAHEIGHNQGCSHNRATGDGPGYFSYSYGYRFQGDDDQYYRTVMSYDGAPGYARIGYFSNPSVDFQGHATGVHESESNSANNAKTINKTAAIVSAFRNSAPSVEITAPADATHYDVPTSITITADVADDGNLSVVEFYDGATLLKSDSTSPYTVTRTLPPGVHVLTAHAIDSEPLTTISDAVTVTVNFPPEVSITAPGEGSSHSAPADVNIDVNATDLNADGSAGTIAKVEFYRNSNLLAEDVTAPYSLARTDMPAGDFAVIVKAYDAEDAVTVAGPVSFTVGGPIITSEARLFVAENETMTYRLKAAILNLVGTVVPRYELMAAVPGMSIDAATGILTFTPVIPDQLGEAVRAPLRVTAVVLGVDSGYDEQEVLIHVVDDPAVPDAKN
jgi:hypothetical protein